MNPRFQFMPGDIVVTDGVIALGIDIIPYLDRHLRGDWGDQLGFDDILANEFALKNGERLLSKYEVRPGISIYVITEADRSRTTFLLPDEY